MDFRWCRDKARGKYRIAILAMRQEVLKRSVFLDVNYTDAMKMKRLCGVVWWDKHAIYNMPNKEVVFR